MNEIESLTETSFFDRATNVFYSTNNMKWDQKSNKNNDLGKVHLISISENYSPTQKILKTNFQLFLFRLNNFY
jgi:hypothetical protein